MATLSDIFGSNDGAEGTSPPIDGGGDPGAGAQGTSPVIEDPNDPGAEGTSPVIDDPNDPGAGAGFQAFSLSDGSEADGSGF